MCFIEQKLNMTRMISVDQLEPFKGGAQEWQSYVERFEQLLVANDMAEPPKTNFPMQCPAAPRLTPRLSLNMHLVSTDSKSLITTNNDSDNDIGNNDNNNNGNMVLFKLINVKLNIISTTTT